MSDSTSLQHWRDVLFRCLAVTGRRRRERNEEDGADGDKGKETRGPVKQDTTWNEEEEISTNPSFHQEQQQQQQQQQRRKERSPRSVRFLGFATSEEDETDVVPKDKTAEDERRMRIRLHDEVSTPSSPPSYPTTTTATDDAIVDYETLYFQALRDLSAERRTVKRREKNLVRVAAQLAERDRDVETLRREVRRLRRVQQRWTTTTSRERDVSSSSCRRQQQQQTPPQQRDPFSPVQTIGPPSDENQTTPSSTTTPTVKEPPLRRDVVTTTREEQERRNESLVEEPKTSDDPTAPSADLADLVRSMEETMEEGLDLLLRSDPDDEGSAEGSLGTDDDEDDGDDATYYSLHVADTGRWASFTGTRLAL